MQKRPSIDSIYYDLVNGTPCKRPHIRSCNYQFPPRLGCFYLDYVAGNNSDWARYEHYCLLCEQSYSTLFHRDWLFPPLVFDLTQTGFLQHICPAIRERG